MTDKLKKFLDKNNIQISDIMYLSKNGRKTVLNLSDGRKIETFIPTKELINTLPVGGYETVNKGMVIVPSYVINVKNNTYIMKDGTEIVGRIKTTKDQRKNMVRYSNELMLGEWEQFSILDIMPLAFCIIELVFNDNGKGIDFIFRYCNKEMEGLEGKSISEMINKSFYEVFENGDRKWLITYADVALNGGSKIIESYSPEIGSNLRIYCFQPKPNFCACALIKI